METSVIISPSSLAADLPDELRPHAGKLARVKEWVGIDNLLSVLSMWSRTERYYHNIQHLREMLEQYESADLDGVNTLERDTLLCAIVYHDAVYDPRVGGGKNEQDSIDLWEDHVTKFDNHLVWATHETHGFSDAKGSITKAVSALIEATKDHTSIPGARIAKLFVTWDLSSLTSDDLTVLIGAERRVLKEYQFYDYNDYRAGRLAILEKFKPLLLELNPNSKIDSLIQYVAARKLKIGIYAGSFYPMHAGHYSIIKRAEKVFDKVIIAPGYNPTKSKSPEQEHYIQELKEKILPYHQVEQFSGLLTKYVQSKRTPYVEPSVIKGLGRPNDFEEEKMQLRYMEDMDPSINVCMFISERKYDYVSSSGARIVKELNPETYPLYALEHWPDAENKISSK